jgi:hypothetical protein
MHVLVAATRRGVVRLSLQGVFHLPATRLAAFPEDGELLQLYIATDLSTVVYLVKDVAGIVSLLSEPCDLASVRSTFTLTTIASRALKLTALLVYANAAAGIHSARIREANSGIRMKLDRLAEVMHDHGIGRLADGPVIEETEDGEEAQRVPDTVLVAALIRLIVCGPAREPTASSLGEEFPEHHGLTAAFEQFLGQDMTKGVGSVWATGRADAV